MEVNVEKIWMKNKMIKGMKFSLPLRAPCWIFRRDFGRIFLAVFEQLLDGFSAGFWCVNGWKDEDSTHTKFS